MLVEHIILALVLILALSLFAKLLVRVTHLPYASMLVLLGFISSEIIVSAGIDTGLRATNFQQIIFYVFIPVLVFESAYRIDKQLLKESLIVILSLAVIAMFSTCLVAAVLLFYGIDHAEGFPWIAALLCAAILAATDPSAVIGTLKKINMPKRIVVLLEGESLFSDASAILLFGLFLSVATASMSSVESTKLLADSAQNAYLLQQFLFIFLGGATVGIVLGMVLGFLNRFLEEALLTGMLTLLLAYGSYLFAEYANVSGVMAVLFAAFSFSWLNKKHLGEQLLQTDENRYLWDALSHVANVSVFLVMGAVISFDMFEQRWLAMLVAIAALLMARLISVYGVLGLFTLFKGLKVPFASQTIIVWGGLRGAVTLALALSLPTTLDYWWTIQSIAFGAVMFSLFVQAPTMNLLAAKLINKQK